MRSVRSLAGFMLASPFFYSLYRKLMFSQTREKEVVDLYVKPGEKNTILDIGCGPADVLELLPASVDYTGFDANPRYIEKAGKRYGNRGNFHVGRVNNESLKNKPAFDIVMAFGILHHLDDGEADWLFKLAHSALKNGGRLVTFDNCYIDDQSPAARYFISRDRGNHVRRPEQYASLAGAVFGEVKSHIRHDLLRIPYTHVIMECKK